MKANKALKRLGKIEASVSDLAKRFLPSAPHIRKVLQDAKAAVIRAKEAVLQASAGTAQKTGAPKAGRPAKKSPPALKKSTGKRLEMKAAARKAKRRAPVKKAAKKGAPKRVPSAPPIPAMSDIAPQEPLETPAHASVVGNA